MSSTTFIFMPTATAAHIERPRLEPGEYRATCTAVKQPQMFREFHRWYMRVDFSVHETGEVVSEYLNLGRGKDPNGQLGPRTNYYKRWTQAAGRKPEKNETMDPALIVGAEFMVTVGDKERREEGGPYSAVESVRREVEALLLSGSVAHVLDSSMAHVLDCSSAQVHSSAQVQPSGVEESSEFPLDQIPPRGPQRWEVLKGLRESDPDKAHRFSLACQAKDKA